MRSLHHWVSTIFLRFLLAVNILESYRAKKIEVRNGFFNETLSKEVYMEVSHGINLNDNEGSFVYLQKALYGLKQAARAWHKK